MSWNSQPDAEHIRKLAERLKSRWARQDELDEALLAYGMMNNIIDVASSDTKEPKAFRSGVGGLLVKEDAALITVTPGIHVNVPSDDPDDEDFASGILEPWLTAMFKQSQQGEPVWDRLPQDLRLMGRAWVTVYNHEDLWSDDNSEYKALKDKLKAAESEDDLKVKEKALDAFKRDNPPIRMRYVEPRGTFTTFDGKRRLPEVIELRKMTAMDIRDSFGEDLVTDLEDDRDCDVITWANWHYCATVINRGKDQAEIVHKYHHNMGKSPYSLIEAELLPANTQGLRWGGALFYATGMIDTFDELLSDLRQNHRENTRTPLLIKLDQKSYDPSNMVAGRPKQFKMEPGSQHVMWSHEAVELAPVVQINPQSLELLRFADNLIRQNMIRPVERGESKSGDSGNIFMSKVQIAEREFDPSMRAIVEGARDVCKSFLRCVRALDEEVFAFPEMKGKGVIGLKPNQARGWENAIQPRASRAIPVDRNIQVAAAQGLLNLRVPRKLVYEQELGYENPKQIMDDYDEEMLEDAAFQMVVQQVGIRAGQIAQKSSPQQLQEIQNMFATASPALQQMLLQVPELQALLAPMAPQGPQTPGGFLQGQANERRLGVAQQPQTPAEMVGSMTG